MSQIEIEYGRLADGAKYDYGMGGGVHPPYDDTVIVRHTPCWLKVGKGGIIPKGHYFRVEGNIHPAYIDKDITVGHQVEYEMWSVRDMKPEEEVVKQRKSVIEREIVCTANFFDDLMADEHSFLSEMVGQLDTRKGDKLLIRIEMTYGDDIEEEVVKKNSVTIRVSTVYVPSKNEFELIGGSLNLVCTIKGSAARDYGVKMADKDEFDITITPVKKPLTDTEVINLLENNGCQIGLIGDNGGPIWGGVGGSVDSRFPTLREAIQAYADALP